MEENSDAHMETDVSSTTDDVDTQEVTGSNGQLEMTITVEKVNEGDSTSNMEIVAQRELSNNVSSVLTAAEKSPLKEPPETVAQKSPDKINEVSKPNKKSPAKTESPQKVTSIISPAKNIVPMSSIELKAESADSSTKLDSLSSPSKDKDFLKEKKSDKDHDVPKNPAMAKIKQIFFVKKSPITEQSITSPSKNSGVQKVQTSLILKSPSKDNLIVEKSPEKKSEEPKKQIQVVHSNKSIKSPPIKLVRKQPNKEFGSHDTTVKNTKVHGTPIKEKISQDTAKPSTSKQESILQTTKVNGESTSPKPSQGEVLRDPLSLSYTDIPMDIIEAEASNDSQLSTASEKEHNKSISRELKSLINSAKESKIISECTQLTSKTRKSRTIFDSSLNMSIEAEITQGESRDSQASESDKPSLKRSMRSQNPDFVTKCKQFLNSVTSNSKVLKDSDEIQTDSETEDKKQKQKPEPHVEPANSTESSPKRKRVEHIVSIPFSY